MPSRSRLTGFVLCCAFALSGTGWSAAQEAEGAAGVSLELSAAEEHDGACRLSFLALNRHVATIESAVYEAVLFNRAGQVARLTLIDLRDLPSGRPRVRQFEFDGLACADVSRVLINGAHACTGAGVAPGACIDGLDLKSLADVELIG